MNTIEQAKKLGNTLKMHPTVGLEAEAADTIDGLIAELAAIKSQEPVAWMNSKKDMTYLHGPYHQSDLPLFLAAGAQSIPSGYQLVPVEPTPAMVDATGATESDMREMVVADYKAMLTAAPVQAQTAQEQPKPPTALSSK